MGHRLPHDSLAIGSQPLRKLVHKEKNIRTTAAEHSLGSLRQNDREAYLRLRLGWKNRVRDPEDSGSTTWNEDHVQPPLLPLVADSQHCVPAEIHSEGL